MKTLQQKYDELWQCSAQHFIQHGVDTDLDIFSDNDNRMGITLIYPLPFKMQVSVGTKNNLGKALSLCHGYSLTQLNNDE